MKNKNVMDILSICKRKSLAYRLCWLKNTILIPMKLITHRYHFGQLNDIRTFQYINAMAQPDPMLAANRNPARPNAAIRCLHSQSITRNKLSFKVYHCLYQVEPVRVAIKQLVSISVHCQCIEMMPSGRPTKIKTTYTSIVLQ